MVKQYGQLYLQTRRALMTTEDPQIASIMARDLLCRLTGKTREAFLADQDLYASEEVCQKAEDAVVRLGRGEPLAYVLGEWTFYGLTLKITPDVLIPRDDTCAVAELAIGNLLFTDSDPRVLDLCCGSGCIGLAIASHVPDARVTLADLSQKALAVAKENVALHKLGGRVRCVCADALQPPQPFWGKFDMIVSNPPYIDRADMQTLDASVKDYEPHMALYGGEDGLDFYRAIAENYAYALKPEGLLCLEFGDGQGDDVCRILAENGYTILERTRDYQDRERAVLARLGRKDDEYGNEKDSL